MHGHSCDDILCTLLWASYVQSAPGKAGAPSPFKLTQHNMCIKVGDMNLLPNISLLTYPLADAPSAPLDQGQLS